MIASQTAHFIEDETEAAIMELLRDAYGEDTPAGRSIDAGRAIVALGKCLIHITAQFDDEDRADLWRTLQTKSDEVRAQLVIQTHAGGQHDRAS